jgi:hypothetical protein
MRRLPIRLGAVDGVWCRAALLHIPRSEVKLVLEGFARATRAHGRLYLAVAEGTGEGWEVAVNYDSDRRRWFTLHRESELTTLLSDVGFRVQRVSRTRSYRDWLSIQAQRAPTTVIT